VLPGSNRGLLPRPCIETGRHPGCSQTDVDGIARDQQRNREPSNNHQVRAGHNSLPGRRFAARKIEFEQLAAASAAAGDKFGISLSQVELAKVLFAQRNVAAAEKYIRTFWLSLGDQESTAAILENLAGVLLVHADLAAAHKSANEAMDVAQKLNEKGAVADAQATLASVLLEVGRAEEAETQARPSAETLGAERAAIKQAVSRSLQAIALLLQNKLPEVEEVSRQAQAAVEKSQLRGEREFIVIRDARRELRKGTRKTPPGI
jgi:hypothetical protein